MRHTLYRFLIGIICIGLVLVGREFAYRIDGKTHAEFFDVGQGDSALMTFPDGTRMLIDGGPDWSTLEHLVETPKKRLLFTGDLESIVERTLVEAHADVRADILKVPHHGSKSSSSTGFLLAVQPRIAIISVGKKNRYGHPSTDIIQRLQAIGAEIRRTDQEGTVELVW